jgi:hypothetical protein
MAHDLAAEGVDAMVYINIPNISTPSNNVK